MHRSIQKVENKKKREAYHFHGLIIDMKQNLKADGSYGFIIILLLGYKQSYGNRLVRTTSKMQRKDEKKRSNAKNVFSS